MPSQIVRVPAQTLASIMAVSWFSLAHAFGVRGMEVKKIQARNGTASLRIHLEPLIYCPELRDHFVDDVYALLLTDAPQGAGSAAPYRLPNDLVLHILDQAAQALAELPGLPGHDALDIAAAMKEAWSLAPAAEVLHRREPSSSYEFNLLAEADRIQTIVAPALEQLDRKAASYQAGVQAAGLRAAIPRLGFQADLAAHLTLTPNGSLFSPSLTMKTRRGGLAELLRATHNDLVGLQVIASAIHEATVSGTSWLDGPSLLDLHRTLLTGVPGEERAGKLRQGEMKVRSPFDGRVHTLTLPAEEVEQEFAAFISGFDVALWRDKHVLIRSIMSHAELARMHGFSDGNGRFARLIVQGILMEGGYSGLPIPAILFWNRSAYLDAVDRAVRQRDLLGLVQFFMKAVDAAIGVGRRMIRLLKPHCARVRQGFLRHHAGRRLAIIGGELAGSMVLGPDPQCVRRTIHGVELAGYLNDDPIFDRVDAKTLGFSLSGYSDEIAFSSPVARTMLSAPMALL